MGDYREAPSDRKRRLVQAAADAVNDMLSQGTCAADVIATLVKEHGAIRHLRPSGNIFRCAGISCSCTWSPDKGLLDAWRRKATVHLMEPR